MLNLYCIWRNNATYDEADAFVIAATSPKAARNMIRNKNKCGDEGVDIWLDTKQSKCKLLGPAQYVKNPQIIVRSYRGA